MNNIWTLIVAFVIIATPFLAIFALLGIVNLSVGIEKNKGFL